MYDPQEVMQTILDLRFAIRSFIKSFQFDKKFENEDDVIGQIIADVTMSIANREVLERATLKTFTWVVIHCWFLRNARPKKRVIKYNQFPTMRDRDGAEVEIEFSGKVRTPLENILMKERQDIFCYALYHVPLKRKYHVIEMLKGGNPSQRSKIFNVTKQGEYWIEQSIQKFISEFMETHSAPYGFADTFTPEMVSGFYTEQALVIPRQ